jgi:hypothetical protein
LLTRIAKIDTKTDTKKIPAQNSFIYVILT